MEMENTMVELRERLKSAADAAEMVSIIYHGGSRAGIARRVLPVRVTEDAVWAIEADGEQRKQFKLAKIELAPEGVEAKNLSDEPSAEPATLDDALAPYVRELEAAPWVLVREPSHTALYGRFKNGKLRKRPQLSISYLEPSNIRRETNWETGEKLLVERPLNGNERPWSVSGPGGSWQYKKLSSATQRFMAEFRAMAGNRDT
jgi:hypothetical protein